MIDCGGSITPLARRPKPLAMVLSENGSERVLRQMSGETLLMTQRLYGSGLHLMECLRFRMKDVGFEKHPIRARDPKGMHDRKTMLPVTLELSPQDQPQAVKRLHTRCLVSGHRKVFLPYPWRRSILMLRKKAWQFIFLLSYPSPDPFAGKMKRHLLSIYRYT